MTIRAQGKQTSLCWTWLRLSEALDGFLKKCRHNSWTFIAG